MLNTLVKREVAQRQNMLVSAKISAISNDIRQRMTERTQLAKTALERIMAALKDADPTKTATEEGDLEYFQELFAREKDLIDEQLDKTSRERDARAK